MPSVSRASLKGIRLVVTYDGTDFAGWQLQPDRRTVQSELEQALREITQEPIRVRVAGRTDAGVHAIGQVVAFDTYRELPMRNWVLALNSNLPHDIAVRSAVRCQTGYQPRHDTVEKTYRYLLYLGVVRDPLLRNRVWHIGKLVEHEFPDPHSLQGCISRIDINAMRQAAQLLIGTHDFCAFRASDDEHKTTRRTILSLDLLEDFHKAQEVLAIEVRGTAFLKHMVRIMVGTLVEVGRGRLTPEQVAALLGPDGERQNAGETAPAHGLTLVSIKLGRASTES